MRARILGMLAVALAVVVGVVGLRSRRIVPPESRGTWHPLDGGTSAPR